MVIAEVGAWVNMLDPDAEKRRANLRYVIDRMALAEAVGARCCVDIAGSYDPKVWYGPDPKNLSQEFFDATVENCRHVIDEMKPKRTRFTIEMMGWNMPDGPDSYLKLIRAVDRPAFGVHMDVCNGINSPTRFYRNSGVHLRMLPQAGAVDRLLPCQGSGVERRVERAFPGSDPGPRRGGLRRLSARVVEAARGRAADAGTSEDRRRVRGRQAVHPENGRRDWSYIRMTRRDIMDRHSRLPRCAAGRRRPAAHPQGRAVQMLPEVDERRRPLQAGRAIAASSRSSAPPRDDREAEEIKKAAEAAGLPIHSVMNMAHWKYPLSSADPAVVAESVEGHGNQPAQRAFLGRRNGAAGSRGGDPQTSYRGCLDAVAGADPQADSDGGGVESDHRGGRGLEQVPAEPARIRALRRFGSRAPGCGPISTSATW